MAAVDFMQLLSQLAIAFVVCLFLLLIGGWVRAFFKYNNDNEGLSYKNTFYNLLTGMVFVVTTYAIVISGYKTIHILIVLMAFLCFRNRIQSKPRFVSPGMNWKSVLELLLLAGLFTLILNFFPESENKQRDSFYYLKIAEALQFTGQENTNNYYNLLSKDYHGVELYHYFEGWLSALLSHFTEWLIPNIQQFRIVTFTILSVVFSYGLFYVYELLTRSTPGLLQKLYCLAFVFFTPDVFYYLPGSIRYYLVYNFESNFLERPNFRLIYLFLIPVIVELFNHRTGSRFVFFLSCLCVINPTVMAMMAPAFLLLVVYQYVILKDRSGWIVHSKEILIFAAFLIAYLTFYVLLSARSIPPMYDTALQEATHFFQQSWKFIILTIVTGLLYVSLFMAIAWYIGYKLIPDATAAFIKNNKKLLLVAGLFIVTGIVMSRTFVFIENLVQVSFNSYMIVSLLIFMLFVPMVKKSWMFTVLAVTVSLGGYIMHKQYAEHTSSLIFEQNDRLTYSGKQYSENYINDVLSYATSEKNILGAYIADSTYYKDLHYGLRNPNIYHLPITYIISNHVRVNDFCLSDPLAIKYDANSKFKNNDYLNNAISRSYYHRTYNSYSFSDQQTLLQVKHFILHHKLQYLVLTSGIPIDSIPGLNFSRKFYDPNTKERFWVIDREN